MSKLLPYSTPPTTTNVRRDHTLREEYRYDRHYGRTIHPSQHGRINRVVKWRKIDRQLTSFQQMRRVSRSWKDQTRNEFQWSS